MKALTSLKQVINFLFLLIFPLTGYAANYTKQLNLYGGVSYANVSSSGIIIAPDERDTIHSTSSGNDVTGGFGISYNYLLPPNLVKKFHQTLYDATFGLDLLIYNTTESGETYLFGEANLANYRNQLQFQTARLMLDGAIGLHPIWQEIIPFITAGAGVARINTKYLETAKANQDIFGGELYLPTHTTYNFVYSFGAGLKKSLSERVKLSVLYLYTNFGVASSSTHSTEITIMKPITAKLQTNTGLLELSVILD
jgi:opacity protein-like surface antigen